MNIVISQLITLTQPEIQLVGVVSDMMVRLTMWANFQSLIMPALQKWFDKGWEAITEVGPSAIVLETIVRTVPNVSFLDVILWFLSFSIWFWIQLITGQFWEKKVYVRLSRILIKLRKPKVLN